MLSFKIKKVLYSLIFIITLICFVAIANYLLVPTTTMELKFEGYRKYDQNIDILFLGNSLTGDSISKKTADELYGLNTFKYPHQGTNPEILYYLLLDVSSKHKISKLICDWDIIQVFQDPPYHYPHSEELYREFLRHSYNNRKLFFLTLKNSFKQRYTSSFFKYSSFPENITNIPAVIKSNRQHALQPNTENNKLLAKQALADKENYIPKKFNNVTVETSYKNTIEKSDIDYMILIKDFCNANNIELTVVSYPLPQCVEESLPQIKDFRRISADFFHKNGITYFDASIIDSSQDNYKFKDAYGHIFEEYQDDFTMRLVEKINTKKN